MRLLLDTHAVVWWWQINPRLPDAARKAISDPGNTVLVSAASLWELATKLRSRKWDAVEEFVGQFETKAANSNFATLPITCAHARLAGSLPGEHRDPFDRMLAAQSLLEGATLVSADVTLAQFGIDVLWFER